MKSPFQKAFVASLVALSAVASASPNLLVNGGFEDPDAQGDHSSLTTPVGWTQIGLVNGVTAYSVNQTPAYDGAYFYDIGANENYTGVPGSGLSQTVATTVGATYSLQFGLSTENVGVRSGAFRLVIGGIDYDYVIPQDYTKSFDQQPFTTQTVSFTASSASTTIAFTEGQSGANGSNDPLIDGISFSQTSAATPPTNGTPEPATLALLGVGLVLAGVSARRKKPIP